MHTHTQQIKLNYINFKLKSVAKGSESEDLGSIPSTTRRKE